MSAIDLTSLHRGGADWTDTYNRALDEVRANVSSALAPKIIKVPCGIYRCDGPINATGIIGRGWGIHHDGAVIESHATGKGAFDLLGSRFGTFRGLQIRGDSVDKPKWGVQQGRISMASAGEHYFDRLICDGHYTGACVYNYGGEIVEYTAPIMTNNESGPDTYCLVQDGNNEFGLASDYITIENAPGTPVSFNENLFTGLNALKNGATGPVIYLRRTTRHMFVRSYASTTDGHAITVNTDSGGHSLLHLDVHCETTGLETCVYFEGPATQPIFNIRGFTFHDHRPHASQQLFKAEPAKTVNLLDIDIRVPVLRFTPLPNGVFEPAAQFTIQGGHQYIEGAVNYYNYPCVACP